MPTKTLCFDVDDCLIAESQKINEEALAALGKEITEAQKDGSAVIIVPGTNRTNAYNDRTNYDAKDSKILSIALFKALEKKYASDDGVTVKPEYTNIYQLPSTGQPSDKTLKDLVRARKERDELIAKSLEGITPESTFTECVETARKASKTLAQSNIFNIEANISNAADSKLSQGKANILLANVIEILNQTISDPTQQYVLHIFDDNFKYWTDAVNELIKHLPDNITIKVSLQFANANAETEVSKINCLHTYTEHNVSKEPNLCTSEEPLIFKGKKTDLQETDTIALIEKLHDLLKPDENDPLVDTSRIQQHLTATAPTATATAPTATAPTATAQTDGQTPDDDDAAATTTTDEAAELSNLEFADKLKWALKLEIAGADNAAKLTNFNRNLNDLQSKLDSEKQKEKLLSIILSKQNHNQSPWARRIIADFKSYLTAGGDTKRYNKEDTLNYINRIEAEINAEAGEADSVAEPQKLKELGFEYKYRPDNFFKIDFLRTLANQGMLTEQHSTPWFKANLEFLEALTQQQKNQIIDAMTLKTERTGGYHPINHKESITSFLNSMRTVPGNDISLTAAVQNMRVKAGLLYKRVNITALPEDTKAKAQKHLENFTAQQKQTATYRALEERLSRMDYSSQDSFRDLSVSELMVQNQIKASDIMTKKHARDQEVPWWNVNEKICYDIRDYRFLAESTLREIVRINTQTQSKSPNQDAAFLKSVQFMAKVNYLDRDNLGRGEKTQQLAKAANLFAIGVDKRGRRGRRAKLAIDSVIALKTGEQLPPAESGWTGVRGYTAREAGSTLDATQDLIIKIVKRQTIERWPRMNINNSAEKKNAVERAIAQFKDQTKRTPEANPYIIMKKELEKQLSADDAHASVTASLRIKDTAELMGLLAEHDKAIDDDNAIDDDKALNAPLELLANPRHTAAAATEAPAPADAAPAADTLEESRYELIRLINFCTKSLDDNKHAGEFLEKLKHLTDHMPHNFFLHMISATDGQGCRKYGIQNAQSHITATLFDLKTVNDELKKTYQTHTPSDELGNNLSAKQALAGLFYAIYFSKSGDNGGLLLASEQDEKTMFAATALRSYNNSVCNYIAEKVYNTNPTEIDQAFAGLQPGPTCQITQQDLDKINRVFAETIDKENDLGTLITASRQNLLGSNTTEELRDRMEEKGYTVDGLIKKARDSRTDYSQLGSFVAESGNRPQEHFVDNFVALLMPRDDTPSTEQGQRSAQLSSMDTASTLGLSADIIGRKLCKVIAWTIHTLHNHIYKTETDPTECQIKEIIEDQNFHNLVYEQLKLVNISGQPADSYIDSKVASGSNELSDLMSSHVKRVRKEKTAAGAGAGEAAAAAPPTDAAAAVRPPVGADAAVAAAAAGTNAAAAPPTGAGAAADAAGAGAMHQGGGNALLMKDASKAARLMTTSCNSKAVSAGGADTQQDILPPQLRNT